MSAFDFSADRIELKVAGGWLFDVDVPCSALGDNIGVPIAVLFALVVLLGGGAEEGRSDLRKATVSRKQAPYPWMPEWGNPAGGKSGHHTLNP